MNPVIEVGVPAVVIFLMTLVGLRLDTDDFGRVLEAPRLVAAALTGQILLLPLLAAVVSWLLGLGPLPAVALVLIAACPAGVLSNVYTLVAGGNGALSITLTAAGTLLSVATLPLVTAVAFRLVPGHDATGASMPVSRTAIDLVFTILVPVGLGVLARPTLVRRPRLERGLQAVGAAATLGLVGILLVTQWRIVTGDLGHLSLAVVLFSGVAFLAADRLARAMRATPADRVALALEFPGRNLGVAAVVGLHGLGRPEIAGLATVVFVVQVPLMFAGSLALHGRHPRPALAAASNRSS
jgi:BASS family bile acid:Na+ symporter